MKILIVLLISSIYFLRTQHGKTLSLYIMAGSTNQELLQQNYQQLQAENIFV